MSFNNKVYDFFKFVAQYLLPACGTLYFALARIWNLPYGSEVVGTITAVDTFLGILLGISSANYTGEGVMTVDTSDEDADIYNLDLNVPVSDLANMKSVTFKVQPGNNQ